jgi:cytochrome b561
MSPSDPRWARYTRTAIALHWIIALAVIAQFTWGWVMQTIPKQPPGIRADAFNVHKSIGLTILALMILRALWRWRHPAPPLPAMPAWQATLARATHGVMYACLFLMPLAGYLGSVFSGYPVKYFGITLPSWGWKDDGIKNAMSVAHFTVSWVLAGAVALHVAGALKHWLWHRDGLVARMGIGRVPGPAPAPTSAATGPPSR